jgi:hypothetical protein
VCVLWIDKKKISRVAGNLSRPTVTAFGAITAASLVLVARRNDTQFAWRDLVAVVAVHCKQVTKATLTHWINLISQATHVETLPPERQIACLANYYIGLFTTGLKQEEREFLNLDNHLLVHFVLSTTESKTKKLTIARVDGLLTRRLLDLRLKYPTVDKLPAIKAPNTLGCTRWMIAAVVAYLRMRLRRGADSKMGEIQQSLDVMGISLARFNACKAKISALL